MTIFNVFTLMGGIAMFLYGMDLMGKALEQTAGSKLQGILSTMTSSPIRGLLLGMAVTAVIQSSGATTVMAVGFVNSGLMELHQAISVIMGANVGTTVTGWLLSLSGLEGDSFLTKMMNPTAWSPILGFIGIWLYMIGKDRKRGVGKILLGFSILMAGMNTMSHAMSPLADEPWFMDLFLSFKNPILGVIAGAVLTAVFSLLASVCGTLVRSPYLAALALCLVCFGGLGLVSVLGELGWWAAYLIACFQPVTVWLSCSAWFTELGLNAVLPWQETIASGLNLLLLGGGVLLALGWFDRKDVS